MNAERPKENGLPAYTLRVSPRARRLRLELSPRHGLMVVVPRGVPARVADELVARHGEWIRRARARLAARAAEWEERRPATRPVAPEQVELRATGTVWCVAYEERPVPGNLAPVRLWEDGTGGRVLRISHGRPAAPEKIAAELREWLRRRAEAELLPELERLMAATGLRAAAVRVAFQRSRWGSCSRDGLVSLNAKLLFLPPELVRYVLLHELCHLRHLDHSPDFYAELERVEPRLNELRRQLRRAGAWVPAWCEPG